MFEQLTNNWGAYCVRPVTLLRTQLATEAGLATPQTDYLANLDAFTAIDQLDAMLSWSLVDFIAGLR